MTQQRLRRVHGLFLATCAVVYVVGIFFLRDGESRTLERAYKVEMLRRVGYCSALLNWLPTIDMLDLSELAELDTLTTFSLSVLTEAESDVRSMTVSPTFPHVAYEYSAPLERVVSVTEAFAHRPTFGCPGETLIVGLSVALLSLMLSALLVKLGNLMAASALSRDSVCRMALAKLCVVVALLIPVGFGAMALFAVEQAQFTCAVEGWQDDIRRTAMLVSELYGVMLGSFRLHIPKTALQITFSAINAALIGDGDYSLHVIRYGSQTIEPPVADDRVRERLLSTEAARKRYSEFISDRNVVVSTYEVAEDNILVGVVRDVSSARPRMSDHLTWQAVLIVLGPLVCATIVVFVFFPYSSLGRISGGAAHLGPWVWRSPMHWPLEKLLQAALLVGWTVFVMSFNAEQLAYFSTVSNRLTENLASIVNGGISLSYLGGALLDNYDLMMRGLDWSTSYLENVSEYTTEVNDDANRFYQSLFTTLDETTYTASSTAEAAAATELNQLPLLTNRAETEAFLIAHDDQGPDVELLEAYIVFFDLHTIMMILSSDGNGLLSGDMVLASEILYYADLFDPQSGEDQLNNIIAGTLRSAEVFARVARAWTEQSKTSSDVCDLYATEQGRHVVALEIESIEEHKRQWPKQLKYDTIYTYIDPLYIGWPLAAIVVVGVCIGLDYFYTARFFGHSRGMSDAAVVKRALQSSAPVSGTDSLASTLPPSNDYTAPRSFINVNHFQLWRSVRLGGVLSGAVALICIVFTVASLTGSRSEVTNIILMRTYEEDSAAPALEMSQTAGAMHASAAAWMRAFLSRIDVDVITAMELTYSWAKSADTSWVDERPTTTDDRFTSELEHKDATTLEESESNLRDQLRVMSNIVFAHLSSRFSENDHVSVYGDYILLLSEWENVLPLQSLIQCTSSNVTALVEFAYTLRNVLLDQLYMYDDAYLNSLIADLHRLTEDNRGCALNGDDIEMFLRRCSLLRRRAAFFTSRQQLATTLAAASHASTEEVTSSVRASTSSVVSRDFYQASAVWLPLVMAWLCLPLVVLIQRSAKAVHRSIYYS